MSADNLPIELPEDCIVRDPFTGGLLVQVDGDLAEKLDALAEQVGLDRNVVFNYLMSHGLTRIMALAASGDMKALRKLFDEHSS